ncbi:hypothetical protein F4806DRAFT_400978 [Annulohypoxylon nitens]|nr:hypothetical protein F4806DRAFT_400978 [Annulohypoxylon nitens]
MRFGSIICGVLPFLGSVCGYANPGACLGTCVDAHDPSIIRRSDGTYFVRRSGLEEKGFSLI